MDWKKANKDEFIEFIGRADNDTLVDIYNQLELSIIEIRGKIASVSDQILAADDSEKKDLYRRRAALKTALHWMLWKRKATSIEASRRQRGVVDVFINSVAAKEIYKGGEE